MTNFKGAQITYNFPIGASIMKLSKQEKLIGLLAQEMKQSEVGELLAASPSFSRKEKEECQTPIKFLIALKKKKCTEAKFIAELERLFDVCNFAHFVKTTEDLKRGNLGATCHKSQPVEAPNHANIQHQNEHFRGVLMKMSHTITEKHLEIMVALAPIPEASKEDIQYGYQLFEQLEHHGYIGENDVELLQEMFELLQLAKPKMLLSQYTTACVPSESLPSGCAAQTTETGNRLPSSFWRKSLSIFSTVTSKVCSLLQSKPTLNHQFEGRKRSREYALDDTALSPPPKVSRLAVTPSSENMESQPPQIFIAENIHITCLLSAANHQSQIDQEAALT